MNGSSYWGSHTGQEIRDMDSFSIRFHAEEARRRQKVTEAQHYCFACRGYDVMVPIAEAHDGTKWIEWKCPKCGAKNGLS